MGCATVPPHDSASFAVKNDDRVVIYGDSITSRASMQIYPCYLETYFRTRYPDWKGEAWNGGFPGDYAGNLERFRQDCLALKPTVITFNMGMNDVSPGEDFPRQLENYVRNVEKVVLETRASSPGPRIILFSPIPFESRAMMHGTEKTSALRAASRAEKRLAERLGVDFVDVNRAMYEIYGVTEALAPNTRNFSDDGVHPGVRGGYFLMAVAFLEGLGAESELASSRIDVPSEKITATGAEIGNWKAANGAFSFVRKLARLPFPAVAFVANQSQVYADREMYGRFRVADRLNRDILTITGLPGKAYDLKIDGKVYAVYGAGELASGVNLGELCDSPDFEQACELSVAVGRKQLAQKTLMRAEQAKKPDQKSIGKARRDLSIAQAEIPKLTHPVEHTIELVPHEQLYSSGSRKRL